MEAIERAEPFGEGVMIRRDGAPEEGEALVALADDLPQLAAEASGSIQHRRFSDLASLLRAGDLLRHLLEPGLRLPPVTHPAPRPCRRMYS